MQTDTHPVAHANVRLSATPPLNPVAAGEGGELIAAAFYPQEELTRVFESTAAPTQLITTIDMPFKPDIPAEGVRPRGLLQS